MATRGNLAYKLIQDPSGKVRMVSTINKEDDGLTWEGREARRCAAAWSATSSTPAEVKSEPNAAVVEIDDFRDLHPEDSLVSRRPSVPPDELPTVVVLRPPVPANTPATSGVVELPEVTKAIAAARKLEVLEQSFLAPPRPTHSVELPALDPAPRSRKRLLIGGFLALLLVALVAIVLALWPSATPISAHPEPVPAPIVKQDPIGDGFTSVRDGQGITHVVRQRLVEDPDAFERARAEFGQDLSLAELSREIARIEALLETGVRKGAEVSLDPDLMVRVRGETYPLPAESEDDGVAAYFRDIVDSLELGEPPLAKLPPIPGKDRVAPLRTGSTRFDRPLAPNM